MIKHVFLTAFIFAAGIASAAMKDRDFSLAVTGTNTVTQTFTLRGELYSVYVDVPSAATGTVTVATAQGTVFTKSAMTADAQFFPRVACHTTAGALATFVGGTNDTANTVFDRAALAGPVTVTVVGTGEVLKTYAVKVIYED